MAYWSSYRCDNNLPVRSVRVALCKCSRSILRSAQRLCSDEAESGEVAAPACRMFRCRRRKLRALHKSWSYKPILIRPNPDIDTKQTLPTDLLTISRESFAILKIWGGHRNWVSLDKHVFSHSCRTLTK